MSDETRLYREPSDYEQGAGTKFSRGDIVTFYEGTEIGIVIHSPNLLTDNNSDRWENFYNVELIDSGFLSHRHIHESGMKIYEGVLAGGNEFLPLYADFLQEHDSTDDGYWQALKSFANTHNLKTEYE